MGQKAVQGLIKCFYSCCTCSFTDPVADARILNSRSQQSYLWSKKYIILSFFCLKKNEKSRETPVISEMREKSINLILFDLY